MKNKNEVYQNKKFESSDLAPWHEVLISTIKQESPGAESIADLGSGNGRLLDNINFVNNKFAFDVSKKAVDMCRQKGYKSVRHNLDQKTVDDKFKAKFDVVTATEVIEHVFDPFMLLRNAHILLKQGGMLYVTTPNFCYYGWLYKYLKGDTPTNIQNPSHIRFFSPRTLASLIETQGYVTKSCTSYSRSGRRRRFFKHLEKSMPNMLSQILRKYYLDISHGYFILATAKKLEKSPKYKSFDDKYQLT